MKHFMCPKKKLIKGFTLAELLVVVAIIAILVCISIPIFSGNLTEAKLSVCQANRRSLLVCYRVNYMKNGDNSNKEDAIKLALSQAGFDKANVTAAGGKYKITDVCGSGGTITAECKDNGILTLSCDKHPQSEYPGGADTQYSDFNQAMKDYLSANGNKMTNKGDFYAQYYDGSRTAVKMSDEYKKSLEDAGLNKTLKTDLYWWTYPVTDSKGNVQYTVTYANTQNDTSYWTSTSRGKMNAGYVVIVNGKTYIRTNSGKTVEPANSTNPYQTEDALEQVLIANSYKPV